MEVGWEDVCFERCVDIGVPGSGEETAPFGASKVGPKTLPAKQACGFPVYDIAHESAMDAGRHDSQVVFG